MATLYIDTISLTQRKFVAYTWNQESYKTLKSKQRKREFLVRKYPKL